LRDVDFKKFNDNSNTPPDDEDENYEDNDEDY
jgi:hypothetical protein